MGHSLKTSLCLVFTLVWSLSFGQTEDFLLVEKNINHYMKEMMSSENDTAKYILNEQIKAEFESVLFKKNAHRYSFENLEHISVLTPKDKKFKLITWHLERSNETYIYSGYITFYSREVRSQVVIPLLDFSFKMANVAKQTYTPEYWFGMLYYDIITVEKGGRKYYTLLGWDGNDAITDKKIIDVLWFDNEGSPRFGAPLFVSDQGIQNKFILEYHQLAAVSIDYHSKEKRIVYDDIQPLDGNSFELKGTYIPTLNFHALKFDGKMWQKIEQVDVSELIKN